MDPGLENMVGKEESPPSYAHTEKKPTDLPDPEGRGAGNMSAIFENPLAGIPRAQLFADVEEFCTKFGLMDDVEIFKKGALISQDPASATSLPELTEDEREAVVREHTHRWSQPWQLYFLAGKYGTNVLVAYRNVSHQHSNVLSCRRRPGHG